MQKAQCYCLRYQPPKDTLPSELKRNLFINSAYHENWTLWKPWKLKNSNNETKAEQIDQNLSSQVKCTTLLRQHRCILLKNAVHCSTCSFHWGVLALQRLSLLPHPSPGQLKVLLYPHQCPLLCLGLLTLSCHHFAHSTFSGKNSKMPETKSAKTRGDFFIFKQDSAISFCRKLAVFVRDWHRY